MTNIHKAAGIIIKDRKALLCRSHGKEFFVQPGGKLEAGETPEQALIRELAEECTIVVTPADLEYLGGFSAVAAGSDDTQLYMDVYLVQHWEGELTPSSEIAEFYWIAATVPEGMEVGSIMVHDILPLLRQRNLIDE